MRYRAWLIAALMAATGALVFVGCGDDDSGGGSGASGGGGGGEKGKVAVLLPDSKSSVRWETVDRPFLKKAFDDAGRIRGRRQRRLGNRLPYTVEQQVTGCREVSSDHEQLRVQDVEQHRRGLADGPARVGDHPTTPEVAPTGELEHLGHGDVLTVAAAQQLHQRAGGRQRLQTAPVATPAHEALRIHQHVAELAREPHAAAIQAAVEDQPRADPAGHLEVDEVARVAGGPERGLGKSAEVRVVVDEDRDVEPAAHLPYRRHANPTGQDRRGAHHAVLLTDGSRQAHAGADHLARVDAGLGQQLHDQIGGGVEPLLGGVVGVERHGPLGEDPRGEVGDRHPQVAVAEVDADRCSRRRVEREEDRRAAALRAVSHAVFGALDDQPIGLQVGDQTGDRRP